jgi:hypothetical protein
VAEGLADTRAALSTGRIFSFLWSLVHEHALHPAKIDREVQDKDKERDQTLSVGPLPVKLALVVPHAERHEQTLRLFASRCRHHVLRPCLRPAPCSERPVQRLAVVSSLAVVLQGSRVEVKGGDVAESKVGARVASSTMFFGVRVMHSAGIGRKTMAKSESCRSWMWPEDDSQ